MLCPGWGKGCSESGAGIVRDKLYVSAIPTVNSYVSAIPTERDKGLVT